MKKFKEYLEEISAKPHLDLGYSHYITNSKYIPARRPLPVETKIGKVWIYTKEKLSKEDIEKIKEFVKTNWDRDGK